MKQIRTIVSILIAAVILLSAATLCAGAIGSPPTNLYWSGATACWSAPSESGLLGYTVTLLKGGEIVAFSTTATAYDFSSYMHNTGEGEYSFSVSAFYSGGGVSETVYSGYYDYSYGQSHTLNHIGFRYATCTEDGVKEHYECVDCGKWYWDSSAQNEITNHSDVVLKAYGHNWGNWTVVKHATETEKGQEKRVCAEDPDHVEYRDIPALGTNKTETESIEATKETSAESESTDASQEASTASTEPASGMSLFGNLLGGLGSSLMMWIIIGAAIFVLLIAAIVILLVLVLRKNKNTPTTPPAARQPQYTAVPQQPAQPVIPQQPAEPTVPQQPTEPAPPKNDEFNDHFNDMQ